MGQGLILLYHRIETLERDPQLLCVSQQNFKQHLDILSRNCFMMSLSEMVQGLKKRMLPERSVAVTFDDGYADNLYNALPLLTDFGINASFYITAGHVGSGLEFWWDDLERCLLLDSSIMLCGKTFDLDGLRMVFPDQMEMNPENWNVLKPFETLWQKIYIQFNMLLRSRPYNEQKVFLAEIQKQAGIPQGGRPTHRSLNHDELKILSESPNVEVGSHTITHPVLSSMPLEIQTIEIAHSKTKLESFIGKPVDGFSYPFGGKKDYSADTVRLVCESGYSYACSNIHGLVDLDSDVFQLPRVLVRDWDGPTFQRFLEACFNGDNR